jgi:hypothetical protein
MQAKTAIDLKERPVLFSGEMVKAILDGRKTQTRRVVKPQPAYTPNDCWSFYFKGNPPRYEGSKPYDGWKVNYTPTVPAYAELQMRDIVAGCPYGKPGDRLWVREAFVETKRRSFETGQLVNYGWRYRADEQLREVTNRNVFIRTPDGRPVDTSKYKTMADLYKWKPSIFMPRAASRITLEITNVRVERLNEISKADVIAEGMATAPGDHLHGNEYLELCELKWDRINGKKYPWSSNPWVWVIEFEREA